MPVRAGVALVGGLLVAAGFAPLSIVPAVVVGLAAFFWALHGASSRAGLVLGWVFGAAFLGVHLFWLRSVGLDAWALLASVEAAFLGPLGALVATASRWRAWPVVAAAAWLAVEQLRSSWPLGGMPWGRLAFATPGSPWAATLPYAGAAGTGLLLALTGAVLAWLLRAGPGRRRPAGLALAGVAVLTAVPVLAAYTPSRDGAATVAVVQGNVPGDGTNILFDYRGVTRNHRDATLRIASDVAAGKVAQPDLVVWPENATAIDPFTNGDMTSDIEESVAGVRAPILVGAIVDDPVAGRVLNQGIVWSPDTGAGDRYTKHHPVPFGEYIPWREHNPLTGRFQRFALISRDMVAGSGSRPLAAAGLRLADALCFDVAFDDVIYPQVVGGAELLTVQTSNATYINTEQVDQQFAIERTRALETGRWTAVAATNGVTGIIRPDGSVVRRLPRRTQGYVLTRVGLTRGVPPGVRVGPWLGRGAALVTVLAALAAVGRYPRRRVRPASPPGGTGRPAPQAAGTARRD